MTTEPYSRKNPFPAEVIALRTLTGEGSPKETFHIEFSLEGSGLEYETGDALGVFPVNNAAVVDALIGALKLDPAASVAGAEGGDLPLRDILMTCYEIGCISKASLTKWQAVAANDKLAALLENNDAVSDYCWGRDILDMVTDFPAACTAEQLVGLLRKMSPRLYSIASSPKAHPEQVHLCVGAVRYTTNGRQRGGACSTYMADRLGVGGKALVYIHSNKNFRLPEDSSKPIIMVGPGTGIAPFRAFWEERIATGATGKNWFFFGNPYKATDYCYEDELAAVVGEGKLKLSVAWSRDQAEKVYVQHLMVQEGEELWKYLSEGGYFYVCGDASRMARDVEAALIEVAQQHGGLSQEDAAAYVAAMRKEKRYQRDVY